MKMKNRLLAFVLSLALIASLLPMSALAAGAGALAADATAVTTADEAAQAESTEADAAEEALATVEPAATLSLDSDNAVALTAAGDEEEETSAEETVSVSVAVEGTATVTVESETELTISATSGNVTGSDGNTIASYTVESTTTTTSAYTAGSTVSSLTSGSSYLIGSSTSGYLTVSSSGSLSYSAEVTANSLWKVTSSTSGSTTTYTLYNETTGYYLYISKSGNSYSLTAGTSNSTTYAWSWSSSYGFYYQASSSSGGGGWNGVSCSSSSTTYYYVSSSSASLSNSNNTSTVSSGSAKVYSYTAGAATTTYTYTITFTGTKTGTGTVDIGGTTYSVTVKKNATTSKGLTISYGWHIANIEHYTAADSETTYTFAVATAKQVLMNLATNSDFMTNGSATDSAFSSGAVTIQYLTTSYNSNGNPSGSTKTEAGTASGYDLSLYYSDYNDSATEISCSNLNLTVYGSDESGDGTSGANLSMMKSTGSTTTKTDSSNTKITYTISGYDESTIYDYTYLTIVPDDGYYVSEVVIACAGSLAADAGSPYTYFTSNIAFTNEQGNKDLFGAYGVGCTSMTGGSTETLTYDPTTGTSVELDMSGWIDSHAEDNGVGDPYILLIELAEIPTPLYVEYEAGTGTGKITTSTIVSTSETGYYATSATSATESDTNSVAYQFSDVQLKGLAEAYKYSVLDPTVTSYTTTENGETVTYYFAGWEVTYYSTASGTYVDGDGNIKTASDGDNEYPTLTGSAGMATGAISYGTNTTLYLYTHVKLVAQWTTEKPLEISYVVDFGSPVTFDILSDLSSELSTYSYSITSVSVNPSFASTSGLISNDKINYTLNKVMTGVDTMTVVLTGSSSGTDISKRLVNITIYPATTVYYEEGFATYGTGTSVSSGGSWTSTGSTGSSSQQSHVAETDEEAAGSKNGSYYVYGYDSIYSLATGASNGTQAATTTAKDSLSFSFTGTGVDIYANCTSTTGYVVIRIQNASANTVKLLTVNTADIGSLASTDATSYNTPIASVTGLTYGSYSVLIYVSTTTASKGQTTAFNFDGFRVYDTIAQETDESEDAYTVQKTVYLNDSEDYPAYTEIRDVVLTGLVGSDEESTEKTVVSYTADYSSTLGTNTTAQVYASADTGVALYCSASSSGDTTYSWSELKTLIDDGAKNELYIPAGVTLVLKLDSEALVTEDDTSSARTIQVGVKTTSGTGSVTLTTGSTSGNANETAAQAVSTVDMFYLASVDVTENKDGTSTFYVSITNSGNTTISLTKLKACDDPLTISSEAITQEELTALLSEAEVEAGETTPDTEENTPDSNGKAAEDQQAGDVSGSTSDTEETTPDTEEETPAVFVPTSVSMTWSSSSIRAYYSSTLTITTSTDVTALTVDGTALTGKTTKGVTTWTYKVTPTTAGSYTYDVVATNAAGETSEIMVTPTLTVTNSLLSTVVSLISSLFS